MRGVVLGVIIAVTGHLANAQEMTLGEFEFRNSCASCHGAAGAGNGPVAAYLTTPPPNLRRLAADNGGVFPVSEVYAAIDGSARVGAHGMEDMPVWGYRFSQRIGDEDVDFREDDLEAYVRVRILALIDHLASMQDE